MAQGYAGIPAGPLAAYLGVRSGNQAADDENIKTLAQLLNRQEAIKLREQQLQIATQDRASARDLQRELSQSRLSAAGVRADQTDSRIRDLAGNVDILKRDLAQTDKPLSDVAKLNADLKAKRITPEQFNASMLNKGGGVGVIPEHQRDLHGPDFLSTLPPGIGATVKGIAEGKVDLRSLSQRGGHREAMMERVTQYDPTFNMATYNTRLGVQKDFTSGVAARNVTAINTAIRHLGTLDTLGEALGNTDLRVQNAVVNRIALETGDPKVNNFDTAKSAVGNELMRVFRQVNASEQETKDWERKFSTASSPAQIKGAIKTGVELLDGRIKALDEQWQRGMNTDKGFPNLITPEAKRILDKIGGKTPAPAFSGGAPAAGGWSDQQERRYQELLRKQGGS